MRRKEKELDLATIAALWRKGRITTAELSEHLQRRQVPLFPELERRFEPLFTPAEQKQLSLFQTEAQRQPRLPLMVEVDGSDKPVR